MKEYKIGIFEEQGGYITIEANNEKEAREKADNILIDIGFEGIEQYKKYNLDITHRDTSIVDEPKLVK